MRILLIARGWPSARDPQWGCFERDQALALQAAGHQVVVMSVDGRTRFYRRKIGITHSCDSGIEVYTVFCVPFALIDLVGRRLKYKLRNYLAVYLYRKVRKEQGRPDLIYAHYMENIFSAAAIKRKYKIPLVAIEHWSMLNRDYLPGYVNRIAEVAYAASDRVIAVSAFLQKQLWHHFKVKSRVIPNMAGREYVEATPWPDTARPDVFTFVSIGSLVPGKGFDLLIQAFHRHKEKLSPWKLVIVGAGREREHLQKLIDSLGLSRHIVLVGKKSKAEMVDILKSSQVFVLASRGETFGVVYIEAMMLGLPVVATACGGPDALINESNGLLVPVENVERLSDAILTLYENYSFYNRQQIVANARAAYAPDVVAKQLTEVFEEVVPNK